MFRVITLTMAVALTLSACAHIPTRNQLRACGGDDTRPWQVTKQPPQNAEELRRMADEISGPRQRREAEVWFKLPSGEIMLCRIRPMVWEWWQFEPSPAGPKITDHDGLIRVH